MLLTILHVIPDADDPHAIVATLMDAVPSGSYLAISHGASDLVDLKEVGTIADSWKGKVQQQFFVRSRDQVARLFDGTDLVEPGLVPVAEWRPEPGTTGKGVSAGWCGVGRKRRGLSR